MRIFSRLRKSTFFIFSTTRNMSKKMSEHPVVKTNDGQFKGKMRINIDTGEEYFSFRGIPFAEPPIGDYRFKAPIPKEKYLTKVIDALDESKMSAQYDPSQYDSASGTAEGGDDCLYLDVASNEIANDARMPVMVWIHGGAFKRSSNTPRKYSPDYLIRKGVVFVGVNYRLGVLGFLNMDHEECSGNMGLKDQILALQWIKKNIVFFGGDPDNVTVFGESAGAASVHALCLSPLAKGLFHKAIMQSGALSNPWANIISNKDNGYALAEAFGKKCADDLQAIQFLRTIPAADLVKKHEELYLKDSRKLILPLVLTHDKFSVNPVVPAPISELVNESIDVPIIIGYNSHEGILRFLAGTKGVFEEMDTNFDGMLAEYFRLSDGKKISKYAESIKLFYFGEEKITEKKINEAVQFFGDMLFVAQIVGVVDVQQKKESLTYLYKFSYQPDFPCMKDRFNVKIKGTCHADELGCLFYSEMRREKIPEGTRDRLALERMTTMWTNFAKFGNPTPEINDIITEDWLPVTKTKKLCFNIDDNVKCQECEDIDVFNLWQPFLQEF